MSDERSLRQTLHERPDVPDQDIDDIIGIAARRQDEARARQPMASREQVEAVAAELDIAPEHIDGAIAELQAQREEAARQAVQARIQSAGRRRLLALVLGALLALGTALGGGAVGGAFLASGQVDAAARETHAAEARLDAVLERQAALAPQLVALAGGQQADLASGARAVRQAETVEQRLQASAELGAGLAQGLAELPPPASEAEATLRLQLHDEIAGSQNRVTVELRRYNEAEAAWRDAASGTFGGLAVDLGLDPGSSLSLGERALSADPCKA